MFDHVGLSVKDVEASLRFYTAALAPLGCVLCATDVSVAGFGPKGGEPILWLYGGRSGRGSGTHVAFRAGERGAVDDFYKRGLEAGGRDHGAPGLRTDYSPRYYAAFLLDPDGHNVEVVCMR